MSSFAVPITEIKEILPHDNATALEIAKVYDWSVVVQKGRYKAGDRVIYVPVDSILPWELENKIFPPESKIKLRHSRVRSIKLRGKISQGMIIDLEDVSNDGMIALDSTKYSYIEITDPDVLEYNFADTLGITKYEPPAHSIPAHMRVGAAGKPKPTNPHFKKYTDIENFKYYDRMFQDGEEVYISEKLHGTSFRVGWFPMEANTLWKKVKKYFGYLPAWEFCWGSRTVQIQVKGKHSGVNIPSQGVSFDDIYTKMVKQYNIREILPHGYALYGEIVGDGVQKNYLYGCGQGEHKLYIYDIMIDGQWQDHDMFKATIEGINASSTRQYGSLAFNPLQTVPNLYVGPFSKEVVDKLRDGDSVIGGQKVREGIVIKPVKEAVCSIGRKVLKYISDAYYLKNQDGTDFH